MVKGVLVGDLGSGHDGSPQTPIIVGASMVKIDGRAAASMGELLDPNDPPKS